MDISTTTQGEIGTDRSYPASGMKRTFSSAWVVHGVAVLNLREWSCCSLQLSYSAALHVRAHEAVRLQCSHVPASSVIGLPIPCHSAFPIRFLSCHTGRLASRMSYTIPRYVSVDF